MERLKIKRFTLPVIFVASIVCLIYQPVSISATKNKNHPAATAKNTVHAVKSRLQ